MEVLHASAPGARVRVMRAAYHSTSGPGIPASSYLVHSSRQVLSSGIDFMENPTLPIKPLEISSTPLDASPDSETEKENYKVTEPDDFDISEPSKWRGSTVKNSIRMPSEESSSTDNASIIDLDSLSGRRNTFRRSFRDKEKGVSSSHKRISPLLDAPVALSTLKYTSLLNGSDDWNDRRKSYSFEDTSPLHKSIRGSDSLTIDSSTDSGIYKSTDIVDDQKHTSNTSKEILNSVDNTFQEWLFRNRSSKFKSTKPFQVSDEPASNISLKSSGKVTITVPMTIESDKDYSIKSENIEDYDRKTKKVGFCKTELHFAAESGTVNIIATDEKPPPSNDFRKRRSAFVPLNDRFEKSITLFGEKVEQSNLTIDDEISLTLGNVDNNENTAATKSILKNKIPKPKPYLLGENMNFGCSETNTYNRVKDNDTTLSAVSLINRQLQSRRRYSDETTSSSLSDSNRSTNFLSTLKTIQKGPEKTEGIVRNHKIEKLDLLPSRKTYTPSSPVSTLRSNKTRELRISDLTYFGINENEDAKNTHSQDNMQEEILHSVKLVQQISNSVSNSEIDSDDAPEHENLPTISNFGVIPTPKPRSKYKKETNALNDLRSLKPIPEQNSDLAVPSNVNQCKLKLKKAVKETSQKSVRTKTNTEGPKHNVNYSSPRNTKNDAYIKCKNEANGHHVSNGKTSPKVLMNGKVSPIYINLKDEKKIIRKTPSHDSKKTLERESTAKRLASNRKDISETDKPTVDGNFATLEKKSYSKIVNQPSLTRKNSSSSANKINASLGKNKNEFGDITKSKNIKVNSNSVSNHIKDVNYKESSERLSKDMKESHSDKEIKMKTAERPSYRNSNKENKKQLSIDYHNTNGISGKTVTSSPKSENTSKKSNYNASEIGDHRRNAILDYSKKPKRSQYVINYDDKHGTVSSICKIKPGTGSSKRKTSQHENTSKVHNMKNNITNKNNLQSRSASDKDRAKTQEYREETKNKHT